MQRRLLADFDHSQQDITEVILGLYTRYNPLSQPPPSLLKLCDAIAGNPRIRQRGNIRYDDLRSIAQKIDRHEFSNRGRVKELRDFLLQWDILIEENSKAYWFDPLRVPEIVLACRESREPRESVHTPGERLIQLQKEFTTLRAQQQEAQEPEAPEPIVGEQPPPVIKAEETKKEQALQTQSMAQRPSGAKISLTFFEADVWATCVLLEQGVLDGKTQRAAIPMSGAKYLDRYGVALKSYFSAHEVGEMIPDTLERLSKLGLLKLINGRTAEGYQTLELLMREEDVIIEVTPGSKPAAKPAVKKPAAVKEASPTPKTTKLKVLPPVVEDVEIHWCVYIKPSEAKILLEMRTPQGLCRGVRFGVSNDVYRTALHGKLRAHKVVENRGNVPSPEWHLNPERCRDISFVAYDPRHVRHPNSTMDPANKHWINGRVSEKIPFPRAAPDQWLKDLKAIAAMEIPESAQTQKVQVSTTSAPLTVEAAPSAEVTIKEVPVAVTVASTPVEITQPAPESVRPKEGSIFHISDQDPTTMMDAELVAERAFLEEKKAIIQARWHMIDNELAGRRQQRLAEIEDQRAALAAQLAELDAQEAALRTQADVLRA